MSDRPKEPLDDEEVDRRKVVDELMMPTGELGVLALAAVLVISICVAPSLSTITARMIWKQNSAQVHRWVTAGLSVLTPEAGHAAEFVHRRPRNGLSPDLAAVARDNHTGRGAR